MEQPTSKEFKDWIQRRVKAVSESMSVFSLLIENGVELADEHTDLQIPCPLPGHGPDNRPSARYYGGVGAHFYCFKCKVNGNNSVSLFAAISGLRFMEALTQLERRFHIRVPEKPQDVVAPPSEDQGRSDAYQSPMWSDIPTVLSLLDRKLARVRDVCPMRSYVGFCRVMDAVQYDFEKAGSASPAMVDGLRKLMTRIDDAVAQADAAKLES